MSSKPGSDEIVPRGSQDLTKAMTAVEVLRDVGLIQKIITEVMKEGTHYGTIPGTGRRVKDPKTGEWVERGNPTLYKAGAEKLASVFRLAVDPEIEDLSTDDAARYRVRCRILSQASGNLLGVGVGEASTDEEKWKWRKASSKEEFNEAQVDRRRNKVKTFYDRDAGKEKTTETLQVRTNHADLANTALKMAKKRAMIDGILTVTAASDIFAQDLEDLPEGVIESLNEAETEAGAEPIRGARPKGEPAGKTVEGQVAEKPEGSAKPQVAYIEERVRKDLWKAVKEKGISPDGFMAYLKAHHNITTGTEIPVDRLAEIQKWVADHKDAVGPAAGAQA